MGFSFRGAKFYAALSAHIFAARFVAVAEDKPSELNIDLFGVEGHQIWPKLLLSAGTLAYTGGPVTAEDSES